MGKKLEERFLTKGSLAQIVKLARKSGCKVEAVPQRYCKTKFLRTALRVNGVVYPIHYCKTVHKAGSGPETSLRIPKDQAEKGPVIVGLLVPRSSPTVLIIPSTVLLKRLRGECLNLKIPLGKPFGPGSRRRKTDFKEFENAWDILNPGCNLS